MRKAIALTFWPSLVVTVAAARLRANRSSALFGPQFTDGYHLMFILAVGLLARAAIGPMERFLNVIGEQRACALVYGARVRDQYRALHRADPAARRRRRRDRDLDRADRRDRSRWSCSLKRRMGLTSSSGADATSVRRQPCTARSNSGFRVELQAPRRARGVCRRRARARRPRAARPMCSTSPPSWRRRRRCSAATCWPAWCGAAPTPQRLIGFFPVAIERRRYGLKMPVLVGWTHPYAPLGTPLIDRDCGEAAVARLARPHRRRSRAAEAAADAVSADRGRRRDHASMRRWSSRDGRSAAFRAPPARDAARRRATAPAISTMRSPHKKRKELRRQRKRLADTGILTSTDDRRSAGADGALADFLSLEASGWKGRAGTAAQGNDAIRRFVGRRRDRARRRRQGVGCAARARRARHRRHRDAAQRRCRVVLEDRL